METKHTDKNLLIKGLKKLGFSLLGLFSGPIIIYLAFSNSNKPLYIPLLVCGIIFSSLGVLYIFKGIKTILDSMFK